MMCEEPFLATGLKKSILLFLNCSFMAHLKEPLDAPLFLKWRIMNHFAEHQNQILGKAPIILKWYKQ